MSIQEDLDRLSEVEGALHRATTLIKDLITEKKRSLIFHK